MRNLICKTLSCLFYKKEKVWMIMRPRTRRKRVHVSKPQWLEVLQLTVDCTRLCGSAAVTTSTCQPNRELERGQPQSYEIPKRERQRKRHRSGVQLRVRGSRDFNGKSGNEGQRDKSVLLWYRQLSVTLRRFVS